MLGGDWLPQHYVILIRVLLNVVYLENSFIILCNIDVRENMQKSEFTDTEFACVYDWTVLSLFTMVVMPTKHSGV